MTDLVNIFYSGRARRGRARRGRARHFSCQGASCDLYVYIKIIEIIDDNSTTGYNLDASGFERMEYVI